jgi:hypothetical protein
MKRDLFLASIFWMLAALPLGAFPRIVNPSFEQDTFVSSPGYRNDKSNGDITGWTGGSGINPIADGSRPFADNGQIPHGFKVGFLQVGPVAGTLSQVIHGFKAGKTYYIEYRVNARAYWDLPAAPASLPDATTMVEPLLSPQFSPRTLVTVSLGGQVIEPEYENMPVASVGDLSTPYRLRKTGAFTPTANGSYELVFTARASPGFWDATVLFDDIRIIQDPPDPNTPPEVILPAELFQTHAEIPVQFQVEVTDPNEPPQEFTFRLEDPAPDGAYLDETGFFYWFPSKGQTGEHLLNIVVTDNGSPPLSTTRAVRILVDAGPKLTIEASGPERVLRWETVPGASYQLFWKDTLNDLDSSQWFNLGEARPGGQPLEVRDTPPPASPARYYRLMVYPFP